MHSAPTYTTCTHQPPSGLTFTTSTLKIEMFSSPPGQKTSLTQETELLESLLQEVEHQVGSLQHLRVSIHVVVLHVVVVVLLELWQRIQHYGTFKAVVVFLTRKTKILYFNS